MSKKKTKAGKYAAAKQKKAGKVLIAVIAVLMVLLVSGIVLALFAGSETGESPAKNTGNATKPETVTAAQAEAESTAVAEAKTNLGYGIYVTDIGSYTGLYMEDGTDEVLSNILMMVVRNEGEQDIQYARITMDLGEQQAEFAITTLPAGESMVLLEKSRMNWEEKTDYASALPKVENIAYFQDPISVLADQLKIQIVDGALNVTNISGADIPGSITVYYKNAAADLLYGGITYRVIIEEGLKADEIRQVMTNHASDTGSRIMFVTIAQ